MDGVTLLHQAHDAGIEITAQGDQLHVRGPKRHVALVRMLFERKAEILALLRSESANDNPERDPVSEYLVRPHLSPDMVEIVFRHYLKAEHGGSLPELRPGVLLSRFNRWREARGLRPTTLSVLREAMGIPTIPAPNQPDYIAKCSRCHGTNWGPSGRHTADGAEVWYCLTCAGCDRV